MKPRLLITLLVCVAAACCGMRAQSGDDADIEARADNIRMDDNYLYGEYYAKISADPDPSMLVEKALSDLATSVNELRVKAGIKPVNKEQLYPLVTKLVYDSGKYRYAFLIISVDKASSFRPSAVENLGDVPGVAAGSSSGGASGAYQPSVSGGDSPAEAAGEEIVVTATVDSVGSGAATYPVAQEIAARPGLMLGELGKLLSAYANEGRVEDFGQVNPGMEIPGGTCLAIVNRSLKVMAVLYPADDGTLRDILTDEVSSPDNYRNKGIVWFK